MMIFGTGIVLLMVFLVLMGRHNEEATFREWDLVLNPEGAEVLRHVQVHLGHERDILERTYSGAEEARREGRAADAQRLLEIGGRVVEQYSPGLLALLRNVCVLSRHAAAIAPVTPLRPAEFQTRELATLAGLHRLGHHLLLTTRERLGFRASVLGYCVRLLGGMLLRTTRHAILQTEAERPWQRLGVLRTDLGTVTDESLSTLRTVLVSLAAVSRGTAASQEKRPAQTP
jgi:hypothetical protein